NLNVPVILIDDGNAPEGHEILVQIAKDFADVELVTHKCNRGKGAAMRSGMEAAVAAGFTHALQVDADGQHDMEAIPFFINEVREHPDDLICGYPEYDESVPKAREQGRKITNFWVAIETLSLKIPDAMCGFRIYPLSLSWPVMKCLRNNRMGVDIESIVRLAWAGLQMRFFPIKVRYPEDGVSNFRMFHDNVVISMTHTMLCFGMLIRLPLILTRRLFKKK
ncbi:MAG: glycosyltransferase family 2 protein, partial [Fibrobacter sp.]|nr:glycosyltransferase family 2 protein [Fibrobacter sp.]